MKVLRRLFEMNTVQMNNEDIVIGKQQGSWLAAGILLIMFFVFIAGYFLGQQKAIEQFSVKVDQESLADKIYTSLYSVYDNPEQAKEEEEVAAVAPTDTPVKEQTLAAKQPEVQLAEASSSVPTPLHTVEKQPDEVVVQPTLYAE
ncbi:MAG TPA: hypothetical protein VLG71_00420, partial [Candidatus Limnocylindria bacterium]|nr:hypothetical protein [Candidatus Limnocylindria bacterium]